jgi:hypothetical protein
MITVDRTPETAYWFPWSSGGGAGAAGDRRQGCCWSRWGWGPVNDHGSWYADSEVPLSGITVVVVITECCVRSWAMLCAELGGAGMRGRWNGQNWSSAKITSLSSLFSDLSGIDCTGASLCLAVDEVTTQRALSALRNGSAWRSENAINP